MLDDHRVDRWVEFCGLAFHRHGRTAGPDDLRLRQLVPGNLDVGPGQWVHKPLFSWFFIFDLAIEELITIVSPATFYRWVREEKSGRPETKNPKGGQRKPKEIRKLVIEIAKTTGFGYTRIIGELRKLGIEKISRQTIRNILKMDEIEVKSYVGGLVNSFERKAA